MLMMRIDPPTKVIMNLWKKEQLDVWAAFGLPLHKEETNMIESAS